MPTIKSPKPSLKSIGAVRRRSVTLSDENLVSVQPAVEGWESPVMVQPNVDGLELERWLTDHRATVDELFQRHRSVLFRGFHIDTVEKFNSVVSATTDAERLEYRDRSTPRYTFGSGVYISTIYPADQEIRLHNEGTYWSRWPLRIYFCCLLPSESGGATPVADVRKVYQRIDPEVRQRFEDKQVMYVRNYNDGIGLPWQEVFQLDDKAEVEAYCRDNGILYEWKEGDRLRTRQIRPAVRRHPETGEAVWFNHAAFFHVSSLEATMRDALLADFAEEDLPYNTYYGDGTRIDPADVETIRQAYLEEKVGFPWQKGDVLMQDNMCFAHARDPYKGDRKIVVVMTEACGDSQ